jgi:uncharacterized membrane protein
MPTTAWRFPGTEGADNAVARLKQLDSQDQIKLMDIAVLRWPDYAAEPTLHEHVHEQGGKVASMVRRLQHPVIDGSMIVSVRSDLRPGTSAVVLLSSGADIDAVVHAFEGEPIELIRSDLSVPDQDRLRQALDQARQRQPGEGSLPTSTNAPPRVYGRSAWIYDFTSQSRVPGLFRRQQRRPAARSQRIPWLISDERIFRCRCTCTRSPTPRRR